MAWGHTAVYHDDPCQAERRRSRREAAKLAAPKREEHAAPSPLQRLVRPLPIRHDSRSKVSGRDACLTDVLERQQAERWGFLRVNLLERDIASSGWQKK